MVELNIKLLAIFLIFIGEAVAIYAEIISAKYFSTNPAFLQMFLRGFIIIIIGASLLICGYALGFSVFKNIWVVSAVSITSILIIEPIMNYTIFRQLPTTGALIGLILGALGFFPRYFINNCINKSKIVNRQSKIPMRDRPSHSIIPCRYDVAGQV